MNRNHIVEVLARNFREKVRIVGENPHGQFSSVWTFVGGGDGFYFSARSLINAFKVSLHANNHRGYLAFEKRYFGQKIAEGRLTMPTKTVCEWALPNVGQKAVTQVASIILPADYMRGDEPPYAAQRKVLVFGVEKGAALEIAIFLSREGRNALEDGFLQLGYHPLFEIANEKWLNTSIVVRSRNFAPELLESVAKMNVGGRPLEPLSAQSNLNMCLWTKPEDRGLIQALDIGGVDLRLSQESKSR